MPNYRKSKRVLAQILQSGEAIIAVDAHIDLDAWTSALALSHLLATVGVNHAVICGNPIPKHYLQIGLNSRIIISDCFDEIRCLFPSLGLIIVPDLGNLDQLGGLYEKNQAAFATIPILHIDHHSSSSVPATISIIDATASSTCEQIVLFFQDLEIPLTDTLSTLLLAGIMSDTRSFSTPTVTPRTLQIVSRLVEYGGDPVSASRLARSHSISQLRLWGLSLAGLETKCQDRVILATITQAMMDQSGSGPGDTSGLVNLMDDTAGFSVACLLKEIGPQRIRVSLRSPGKIPVIAVAEKLGGGGHTYAAAFTLERTTMDNAKEMVTGELCQLLAEMSQAISAT